MADQQAHKEKAATLLLDYQEKQQTLTNPKAHDDLEKELALQQVEVELAKKKIKEYRQQIAQTKEQLTADRALVTTTKAAVADYQEKLAAINATSQEGQDKIQQERNILLKKLSSNELLPIYEKLRLKMSLVVTQVLDGACNGCYILVPLQGQIDIRAQKNAVFCENCARLLTSVATTIKKVKDTPASPTPTTTSK